MKIIDLLNDIENDEIEDGTIFEVIGDFFYKLIVIDKNLYCINEMTKQLEILDSKYIGRFDNRQYEIIKLSNKVEEEKKASTLNDIRESYGLPRIEKKKIPEKILNDEFDELTKEAKLWKLFYKYNELIDYLKSKGE